MKIFGQYVPLPQFPLTFLPQPQALFNFVPLNFSNLNIILKGQRYMFYSEIVEKERSQTEDTTHKKYGILGYYLCTCCRTKSGVPSTKYQQNRIGNLASTVNCGY